MNKSETTNLEVKLLLEAIYQRYGYDYRNYARASIKRRIQKLLKNSGLMNVSELIPMVIHDPDFFESVIRTFSISVTEMFRDPHFYLTLREQVIPVLKTYPFIKIWHAGCATGEEVYSMAILLHEEGLYQRSQIYATDISDELVNKARDGIFDIREIKNDTLNYQQSGGKCSFSDYYHSQYKSVIMDSSLKQNITFSTHNLTTDSVFGEMHLVICRNVMIYFNRELQERVFKLFTDSLIYKGFLCLGTKETLDFSTVQANFKQLLPKEKIYRKQTYMSD